MGNKDMSEKRTESFSDNFFTHRVKSVKVYLLGQKLR